MNRITEAIVHLPTQRRKAMIDQLKHMDLRSVDLAPAFSAAFAQSPQRGTRLREVYAITLSDPLQHRALFQNVALMPEAQRQALIQGYRKASQGRGVVHAISQLPRA